MKWVIILLAIAAFGLLVARLCRVLVENFLDPGDVDDSDSIEVTILRCGDRYFQRWDYHAETQLEGPPSYESIPIFTDERALAMRFETQSSLNETIGDLHQFHRLLTPEPIHAVSPNWSAGD